MTTSTAPRINIVPVALIGVALLGVGGFYGSFTNVARLAALHQIDVPWLVPAVVDGAIAMFTLLDLGLAWSGKRVGWLHWFEWALVAVTVILNVSGATDLFGLAAHAALPLLWVAAVSATKATIAAQAAPGSDRIPLRRWLCAPWPTLRLWRRMSVWGITSYEAGLDLERRRMLARIEDRHGSLAQAPARQRELYRLIAAAAGIDIDEDPAPVAVEVGPFEVAATAPAPRRTTPRRRPRPRHTTRPARAADVDVELVKRIRRTAAERSITPADLSQRQWLEELRSQPEGGVHVTKLGAALRHIEEESSAPLTS